MQKALNKAGWSVEDVDLWEINEAFAVVAMIAMRDLGALALPTESILFRLQRQAGVGCFKALSALVR